MPSTATPAPATLPAPSPPADGRTAELVLAAMGFLDRPYQRGGQDADMGFDCSGFTRYLYGETLGIELPRRAEDQARANVLRSIPRDALRSGDLVFFNTLRHPYSHVGMYIGEDRFIHAPRTGAQVRIESLSTAYWDRRFTGARRPTAFDAPADRWAVSPP